MRDSSFGSCRPPVRVDVCPSVVLLWVTCTAYAVLIVVSTTRIVICKEFADDLADPRRGFGMFTFVAASDVGTAISYQQACFYVAVGSLVVARPAALPAAARGSHPALLVICHGYHQSWPAPAISSKWLRTNGYRHQRTLRERRWCSGPSTVADLTAGRQHMETCRPPCPAALRGKRCGASFARHTALSGLPPICPSSKASANLKVGSRWRCGRSPSLPCCTT